MSEKKFFPFFLNIEGKKILVFGAGKIGTRRIRTLVEFGAQLKVVAPEVTEEVRELAQQGRIQLEQRSYRRNEIDKEDYVLAATDEEQVNLTIARECRHKEVMVNNASDQNTCDFYFPGIVETEDVVIGITASGRDHSRVRVVREQIQEILK